MFLRSCDTGARMTCAQPCRQVCPPGRCCPFSIAHMHCISQAELLEQRKGYKGSFFQCHLQRSTLQHAGHHASHFTSAWADVHYCKQAAASSGQSAVAPCIPSRATCATICKQASMHSALRYTRADAQPAQLCAQRSPACTAAVMAWLRGRL